MQIIKHELSGIDNLEYQTKKYFFIYKTLLPSFDWDINDGVHFEANVTIQEREDVPRILNEWLKTNPEYGFYLEATPGGVRGFLNKIVDKATWTQIAKEVKCDPDYVKLAKDPLTWNIRVSPKPKKCLVSTKWCTLGQAPTKEVETEYAKYRSIVDFYESSTNLHICRESEFYSQDMYWAQAQGWAKGYGKVQYVVSLEKIDIEGETPNEYEMGQHQHFQNSEEYKWGKEQQPDGNTWISFNPNQVKIKSIFRVTPKEPDYKVVINTSTSSWKPNVATPIFKPVVETEVTKESQSLISKIKSLFTHK